MDQLGLKFRVLCSVAADMGMDRDPLVKEIRSFFQFYPQMEAEMEQRMPTEEQFAAWVESEARDILKALKDSHENRN